MIKKILIAVVLVGAILLVLYASDTAPQKNELPAVAEAQPVVTGQATYQCADSHTIKAVFATKGPVKAVLPGEPPVSNGVVMLQLDAEAEITLPQVLSADGGRYANVDETLVFWSKGSGAMVLENGVQTTYKNCIEVKADTGTLPQVYLDEGQQFTVRYPADYRVDSSYQYQNLGPKVSISGVKFTIPAALASGTNLSSDSYLSVEHREGLQTCLATDFLSVLPGVKPLTIEDGDATYSVASSTDAGAGNRYEENVYALVDSNPCLAVRYFIHYSAIENYDPGVVTEFDKAALLAQFDAIRLSLTRDTQRLVAAPLLNPSVYPLYDGVVWGEEESTKYEGMTGYQVTSETLPNISDIAAVTKPFETYYANLLKADGWTEDITMAAGGPGSAIIAYKKGDQYIVLEYGSEFGVTKENTPAECPCQLTFSIFSGTK